MDNMQRSANIMIKYSLRLVQLCKDSNFILKYRDKECKDLIWNCQVELSEWNSFIHTAEDKSEFYKNDEIVYAFAKQLLYQAKAGVLNNHPDFKDITIEDINKIILF